MQQRSHVEIKPEALQLHAKHIEPLVHRDTPKYNGMWNKCAKLCVENVHVCGKCLYT